MLLSQTAIGGAGGASAGDLAGIGGAASSSLTVTDATTVNHKASTSVEGDVVATGGAAGAGNGSGNVGVAGGNATAASIIAGTQAVTAKATATGWSRWVHGRGLRRYRRYGDSDRQRHQQWRPCGRDCNHPQRRRRQRDGVR